MVYHLFFIFHQSFFVKVNLFFCFTFETFKSSMQREMHSFTDVGQSSPNAIDQNAEQTFTHLK